MMISLSSAMRELVVGLAVTVLGSAPVAANEQQAAAITVSVDSSANVHPFSPRIFGVSYGDAARNGHIGYPLVRWGGNSTTRYNWKVDVHNTVADYFFENIPGATDRSHVPPLNNDADAFVSAAIDAHAEPLMTIPTIGWTPRTDSPLSHPYFAAFSVSKYGAQQSTDPYDTDAGNGKTSAGNPITGNDPTDTSFASGPAFQQAWIAHLQAKYGDAAHGGVQFYSLDNEVMLWNSTQRDVHPAPTTYDETWNKAASYGAMIKQQDPHAQITGPVTWGYCDLFGSAKDNCVDGTDRDAHGGMPFIAWYLKQVCDHPLPSGQHVVDYLDLHYYPQGSNVALSDDDSPATAARRLAALKELYDAHWVSDSWISDLGDDDANHYSKPDLIPRARAWIDQYCPGTKLAITEYNWGNDNTESGAVAQAELFGIFAREGVDMAARWIAPTANSKVERAFSLFLNYDGQGARVSGDSVSASSSAVDTVGAYAFQSGAQTTVLLTNKTSAPRDITVNFAHLHHGAWQLYGFDSAHAVHLMHSGTLINANTLDLNALPGMSASLLVVQGDDTIFRDGFD